MILLYTDFGAEGPYLGQVEAVLRRLAPGVDIVNLLSNAPADPLPAGYLLDALAHTQPRGATFLCVVDPGVGGDRHAVVLEADGRRFVGPDNGLLNGAAARATDVRWRIIEWRPDKLSASFHGRDLFAPIAARIAQDDWAWAFRVWNGPDLRAWPADFYGIVYLDHYGNALTGLRYSTALEGQIVCVNNYRLTQAPTFCGIPEGKAFWYCNSMGLVEIAVNRGRADVLLGLKPGTMFTLDDTARGVSG